MYMCVWGLKKEIVKALSHLTGSAVTYTNILSSGEITSSVENVRLTGLYLQRTSPNTNMDE